MEILCDKSSYIVIYVAFVPPFQGHSEIYFIYLTKLG